MSIEAIVTGLVSLAVALIGFMYNRVHRRMDAIDKNMQKLDDEKLDKEALPDKLDAIKIELSKIESDVKEIKNDVKDINRGQR